MELTTSVCKKKPFIATLLKILDRPDLNHIINWTKDGSEIIIKAVVQLELEVLPNYFDSSRMDSFSRQLNIYGFKRVSDSRKQKNKPLERVSVFYNPNFHRDKPELLKFISRKKTIRLKSPKQELPEFDLPFWGHSFPTDVWRFSQTESHPIFPNNALATNDSMAYYSSPPHYYSPTDIDLSNSTISQFLPASLDLHQTPASDYLCALDMRVNPIMTSYPNWN